MMDTSAFVSDLRHALSHLGNAEYLRNSPLVDRFELGRSGDAGVSLRQVLESAIEAFRPTAGSLVNERTRRYHEILVGRYMQGLTQQAVGNCLGITPRHVRREQEAALCALGRYLEVRLDLRAEGQRSQVTQQVRSEEEATEQRIEVNREMRWLADSFQHRVSAVEQVIAEVSDLIQGLAEQHAACYSISCDDHLPSVSVPRIVLRQVILNLITAAMQNLGDGSRVLLEAQAIRDHIMVTVMAKGCLTASWHTLEPLINAADLSRQLTELFDGRLILSEMDDWLIAQLHLPYVCQETMVLAVEDNVDTLRLWRRYVQETSFRLVEVTDSRNALTKVIDEQPAIVILDVMMQGIDGWELLRSIREHPLTTDTPIIVCTVLPQRDLALSLGASDFIQKPTTGREFRAVLERQIAGESQPG